MPTANANGIQIEYDSFGHAAADPIVLIMGVGAQMIAWPEPFCRKLADRGHHVVRFDNRDAGLSTKFDDLQVPDIAALIQAQAENRPTAPPYTLDDMARDAIGLLDAIGPGRAHFVGVSMGGMIAQVAAIQHPGRVKTLTSIMSNTGASDLPPPRRDVLELLTVPVPHERDAHIDHLVRAWRILWGSGFPFDEVKARERAARTYDRAFCPEGTSRQTAAMVHHGNRRPALERLQTPTLVIHGSDDPLIPVECARDLADAVPGARLVIIEGMGHNLPEPAWDQIVDAIACHARGN